MGKKGKRYSPKEKKDILANYNQLRESGTNAYDAAKKVGISYITIRSWEKKGGVGRRPRGAMAAKQAKTVVAATTSSSGGIVLTCPNGVRVEGLGVEEAVKIIKSV